MNSFVLPQLLLQHCWARRSRSSLSRRPVFRMPICGSCCSFNSSPRRPILIGSSRESLLALGREATTLNESTEATEADALAAVTDLWSDIAASLAASITARSKQEVSAEPVQALTAKPPDIATEHVVAFELRLPDSKTVSVQFVIHPNLIKAVSASDSMAGAQALQPMNTKNLDLLLDVEMPVSVSFGRAQLPLKDVIKLTTGSIVELSRSVSEPVDIIVNNCIIARGEVVVVEGNFGVRIERDLEQTGAAQNVS